MILGLFASIRDTTRSYAWYNRNLKDLWLFAP